MRRTPVAAAVAAALCAAALSCAAQTDETRFRDPPPPTPGLSARVTSVPAEKLTGTYRPGCPVVPERLRLIRMNHWGFDGTVHRGELVVHEDAVGPLLHVFERALEARFPIRRMRVMAAYDGDDARAMADDNTSAFNCRRVTGDPRWVSRHAWGDAVDINPVENPYVDVRGTVHPPNGRTHLTRADDGAGQIHPGDAVLRAFREVGWYWGGRWANRDYQHFSATGH
ncbi:M15 family metallopeptidase [Streptomyces sp. WAC06614]|uniref:M15 family metallopeptidase n=1 Tax=Streptomyces sp. WAC06614 TaxID=2487416 RepID=UPI000F79C418|nr:M15 family metallopeptidase [Streptomyces sp. WAC06614]RSS84076.1 M15 family peptidase [Streptomyces sp. WAC06614]